MTLTQLYPSKIRGPLITEYGAEFSISHPLINKSMMTAGFEPTDPSGKPAQLQAGSEHGSRATLLGSAHAGDSPPAPNTAELAAKRNRMTRSASTGERTSSHGLKLQQGRFRLGIRQSLLTGRIIKRRNRLPGEGQELPFLKVLQAVGNICHTDPALGRGWIRRPFKDPALFSNNPLNLPLISFMLLRSRS